MDDRRKDTKESCHDSNGKRISRFEARRRAQKAKVRRRKHIQTTAALLLLLTVIGVIAGNAIKKAETARLEAEERQRAMETPSVTSVDLVALGDILMHMPVVNDGLQSDGTYNYNSYFEMIREDIEAADIAVINQETILGGAELEYSGYPTFNSPQEMGDALVYTGFDVVLQANNHSMDRHYEGISNAMTFWQSNHPQIFALGLNDSAEEQDEINVIEVNDIKIALLNYTYGLNGIPLPEDKPYLVNLLDEVLITDQVTRAKQLADVVIVFPHWGTEYSLEPDEDQESWANLFLKLGVDIVIGGHPHVVEPVEWLSDNDGNKMLIYYSLGNCISCQDETPQMLGGMACITIEKSGEDITITNAGITPIVTHFEVMGAWNYKIYKLEDYTDDLAAVHRMTRDGEDFTTDVLWALAKAIKC